jgi:hypothetical protein
MGRMDRHSGAEWTRHSGHERHEKTCIVARSVTHACGSAMHVLSTLLGVGIPFLGVGIPLDSAPWSRYTEDSFYRVLHLSDRFIELSDVTACLLNTVDLPSHKNGHIPQQ